MIWPLVGLDFQDYLLILMKPRFISRSCSKVGIPISSDLAFGWLRILRLRDSIYGLILMKHVCMHFYFKAIFMMVKIICILFVQAYLSRLICDCGISWSYSLFLIKCSGLWLAKGSWILEYSGTIFVCMWLYYSEVKFNVRCTHFAD